jgi:uncharacterized protein YegJ (DUF2314 family)
MKMWLIIISFVVLIIIGTFLLLCSCAKKREQKMVPAGSPMTEFIHFQFAIYYLPVPANDPLAVLRHLVAAEHKNLTIVDEIKWAEAPTGMVVRARIAKNVQEEYAPPNMEALQYFGHGVSREQAQALQKCEQALVLDFGHPKQSVLQGLHTANELAEHIARETDGLLWDEQTREVFSPDEWHKQRLTSWIDEVPDVSKQTAIHSYKSGEYPRAVTLGMAKFGLPDVVIEDFSWALDRTMGDLIKLLSQAMAEGASFEKAGEFDLDIRAIAHPDVRQVSLESLKPNTTPIVYLSLRQGIWQKGDPLNRLIEITFDRYPGRDVHAKHEKMSSSLFGWKDSISAVDHPTDELLTASQKAKDKLPALREAFTARLQPGEFIQVKAPFSTPDGGREYMWIQVTIWKGDKIEGLLLNEPYHIPDLHGGQTVKVRQEDVFDYIRQFPDGTVEGNETEWIIQQMGKDKQ